MLRSLIDSILHKNIGVRKEPTQNYQPVILITGCSSGIGLALAQLLQQQHQYRIIVTARNVEPIKGIFPNSSRCLLRTLDVTNEIAREALVSEITQLWGGVDILINNAGISYRSVVEHMTEYDEQKQMNANYFGPIGLIRLVLPGMREKGRGKIINVSSVSGMLAMPTMASYTASKHALEGASEALWYETKPFGINVSLVQPGFVHSQSFKNVYYSDLSHPNHNHNSEYGDFYSHMEPFVERLMNLSRTTPEKVAALILKVIQTQNPVLWIPATPDALVFHYLRRLLPRRILLPFLFYCLPQSGTWSKKYSHKRHRKNF